MKKIILPLFLLAVVGISVCWYPFKNWYQSMKNPEKWDRRPHFVVYNCLYFPELDHKENDETIKEEDILYEGVITTSVASYESARENEQSNFGTGYQYRYLSDGGDGNLL